ncbi:MAG: SDR family oxidoreductase [Dehalococcoidales bacterium]|nr:SDR family oxidoreductase [Dehalococcoidales bacterium]
MFKLDGKVAVVTGGAGGLGEYCALALAQQGAKVVIASRTLEKLQAVAQKMQAATNSEVTAMQLDVTDESSCDNLVKEVVRKYGKVDILVNAHGMNAKMAAADIDFTKWEALFAANVKGVMMTCKSFGKAMIAAKKGKIINLSSVRGIRGTDGGNTAYGATKGAVDMITRMLAAEWAPYNINVNAIGASVVLTETFKKTVAPERMQLLLSKTLFKKFATPEDIAAACVYLASDEANYVTGQIMYVDGGLTAVG